MRRTGVWMVSVDRDHDFRGQHLLELGTRSGYPTVISRMPCARVLCCAARLEEEIAPKLIPFGSMIVEKSF